MKPLIACLLLVSLAAYGQVFRIGDPGLPRNKQQGKLATSGGGGGGSPPTSPLISEHFEAAGYDEMNWNENLGTPLGTIDEDYTSAPLAGSQSLRIVKSTADQTYIAKSIPAGMGTDRWAHIICRFTTLPTEDTPFLQFWESSFASHCSAVSILSVANGSKLRVYQGAVTGTTTDSVLIDTTYHIWFLYNDGTGANGFGYVGFSTDGTRPTSGNNKYAEITTGTSSADPGEFEISLEGYGGTAAVVIVDTVWVDDEEIGNQ